MVVVLPILAVLGSVAAVVCATGAVAAGLYIISELIETRLSVVAVWLRRLLIAVIATHVLLFILDGLPWKQTLFSLFCCTIHYRWTLPRFPHRLSLSSPPFVATCLLSLASHAIWFHYFNNPYIPSLQERLEPDFVAPHYPAFAEVAAFFALTIWAFPFALFVAVSSVENELPVAHNRPEFDNSPFNHTQKHTTALQNILTAPWKYITDLVN